jgi:hypothetical protein
MKHKSKNEMKRPVLDEIDREILERVNEFPGAPAGTILNPLRTEKQGDPFLRYRIKTLARDGYLRLEKTRSGKLLIYPAGMSTKGQQC